MNNVRNIIALQRVTLWLLFIIIEVTFTNGVAAPPPPASSGVGNFSLPWYTSVSYEPYHKELFRQAFQLLEETSPFNNANSTSSATRPPYSYLSRHKLRQAFDFSLSYNRPSNSNAVVMGALRKLTELSPNHAHPLYLDKDGAGLDPIAVLGEFLTATISRPIATYLFAPVVTLQEEEVAKGIRRLVGYRNPDKGDGTFSADPSISAIIAVRAAIHKNFKEVRNLGYSSPDLPPLALIVSEFGNPYWEKVAVVTGLGLDALKRVKADEISGKMNIGSLNDTIRQLKSEGKVVVMVIATLGSDPQGAIDPLQEIAQICKKHDDDDIWLHVDGHYGGPLIFLNEPLKSSKLRGLAHSDSFMLGCSGMLGVPHVSSILVTKRTDMLHKAVGLGGRTSYIYQMNELYDHRIDSGDHSIQCSRRAQVNALWLVWQVRGSVGLGSQIQRSMQLAQRFYEELRSRDNNFQVVQPETTRVLFYYNNASNNSDRAHHHISSRKIRRTLLKAGGPVLGITKKVGGRKTTSTKKEEWWFAVSVTNPSLTIEILRGVLDQIEDAAAQLLLGVGKPAKRVMTASPSPPAQNEGGGPPLNTSRLMRSLFSLMEQEAIYFQSKRAEPVFQFRTPETLRSELSLELPEQPRLTTESSIISALAKKIELTPRQAHPYYIYHVNSAGLDPHSMIADYFSAAWSSACLSYADSPVYTLMEEEVMLGARRRLGYPEPGDGLLVPTGSLAVMTAFYTARANMFPATIQAGLQSFKELRLVAFMSANAHYCVQKAALSQGVGFSNVVLVPVDPSGAMDVAELRKAIQGAKERGETPFYVQATAGTTVLGRFPPIRDIAQVCREHKLWMHLDGTIGGGYMFSEEQLATKLASAKLADSINFNIHKTLGLGLSGSVLLFRDKGVLDKAFGRVNKGTLHAGISWSRRPDILKMWLTWKAKGTEGFGLHIDYTFRLKAFLLSELKREERKEAFILYKDDFDAAAAAFYYLPQSMRALGRDSPEFKEKLSLVSNLVQKRMVGRGVPIGTFKDGNSSQFLKIHVMSSGTTEADVVYLLDLIDSTCGDIVV